MQCDNCNVKMTKIDRRRELAELDDDATEGQMADYFGAEASGDYGAWSIGVVEYECPKCRRICQIITDDLNSYAPLILRWHDKSKEGDYFSRFVFEYLAFSALLRNRLCVGAGNDRAAIQSLKRDEVREGSYVAFVATHEPLRNLWRAVMAELGRMPLHNSSRDPDNPEIDGWWDNKGTAGVMKDKRSPGGVVRSLSDWENMVEFWYGVRNNLFHGGKDPSIQRDCFLVEHAYRTLAFFMESEVGRMTI